MPVNDITAGASIAGLSASQATSRPRRARFLLLSGAVVSALAAGFAIILLGRWPMLRAVETGRTPEYPYLEPLSFSERPEVVLDWAKQGVGNLRGWTLQSVDRDEGFVRARVRSTPFRFESDVVIRISRVDGVTRVTVRSESVGSSRLGDFGQNARNIRRFLRQMRFALAQAHTPGVKR